MKGFIKNVVETLLLPFELALFIKRAINGDLTPEQEAIEEEERQAMRNKQLVG